MNPFYKFTDQKNNSYTISLIDASNYPLDGVRDPDLRTFFKIYQTSILEHREHVEVICDRLKYQSTPITYLAICRCIEKNTVIGGYILEYYPNSTFCLLSYIFIKPSYSDNQVDLDLGKSLHNLIKDVLVEKQGKKVKAVLFELASHPDYKEIGRYAPDASFFSKIKGVWIDIPYVEPVSGNANYLIGAIPVSGNLRENVFQKDLYHYLSELYSVSSQHILNSEFFVDNIKPWSEGIDSKSQKITDKIKEFPRLIRPRIQLSKVSIALHFVQENGINMDWIDLKQRRHIYDTTFNSYEKDLFSHRFVDDPPYYSRHYDVKSATIRFNNILSFNSEGREETFILVDEDNLPLATSSLEKDIKVFLNYTVFKKKDSTGSLNDNSLIWEVVLSPLNSFNEYELIQLEKFFTGTQEQFTINLKYTFNKTTFDDLFDFVESLIGTGPHLRKEVLAGTIQVDTSGLKYLWGGGEFTSPAKQNWNWNQLYQYYNSDFGGKKNGEGADKLQLIYTENEDACYILNTFCGIALGIFDFDRMSIEEVKDTLVPLSQTDSYFLILNKSSIACFCMDNNIYVNALESGIGINPYLIIPNAVLAYNSYLTIAVNDDTGRIEEEAAQMASKSIPRWIWIQKIKRILQGRSSTDSPDKLATLIQKKRIIGAFLKNLVPNVFQYETERELYNYGMEKRGIIEKREDLEEDKRELEDDISHLESKRTELLGRLSLILGIISLSQIYQLLDAIKSLITNDDTSLSKYAVLIVTFSVVILFAYISFKEYRIVVVDKRKSNIKSNI